MGMCGGGPSAPPPDPNIGAAAVQNAALANRQQDFAEKQYGEQKSYYDKLVPTYDHLLQGQVELSDLNKGLAVDQNKYYKENYVPIEQKNAAEATQMGNAQSQEEAAGKAGTDVQRSFDMSKAANARSMAQMGVNPNSGRFAEGNRSQDIMEAAAKAGASTAARTQNKAQGQAARLDQANFGRGFAATQMSATNTAGTAGGNAQGMGMNNSNTVGAMGTQFQSGMSAAGSTRNSAAGILQNQQNYGMQVAQNKQAQDAQSSQAIGSIVGIAAMAMM